MPLFPGERPMTPEEGAGEMGAVFLDVENAFAHEGEFFSAVTGLQQTPASFRTGDMLDTLFALPPDTAHFSVVEAESGDFDGYIIARPFRQIAPNQFEPDPHRWWVFDSDLDESDAAWVALAEFTPDGFINHGDPPDNFYLSGGTGFNGQPPFSNDPDAGLDPDEDEPNNEGEFLNDLTLPHASQIVPRDPNVPLRSIDDVLDDAEDKSLPHWRRMGTSFEVLESPLGTAFLCLNSYPAVGVIRYIDGVCVEITGTSCDEIRHAIPRALRDRPVAMQTLDLDEDVGASPDHVKEEADPLADTEPPKPPPPRKWNTVSIRDGVEDE